MRPHSIGSALVLCIATLACVMPMAGCGGAQAELKGQNPIIDIDVGGGQACAVRSDGAVFCWGSNMVDDGPDRHTSPRRIDIEGLRVESGSEEFCVLQQDRRVSCWVEDGRQRVK